MHTSLKNNPAKFHPDLIWNYRALGFFEDGRPNKTKQNKMSSDVRSVPELKNNFCSSIILFVRRKMCHLSEILGVVPQISYKMSSFIRHSQVSW